ncbi:hypothetical protein BD410DRAFT_787385 [Rickenella mellea]|uniref:CHAT domain-containing protein n=1 Tax=Rickenella mellea TaxID=50990 RepID=A0A4Y7Q9Q4_9AGAM|nr:hypothetical protein BD410DRAFT_787385 [Rickenella mellea]
MALEWLEQGRSVVWGQLLRLRTPVDDLRDVNFDLAQKLSDIASSLEGGRASHTSFAKNEGLSSEQTTQKRHRQLAEEWESLVKEVQTIKGFERFLLPKQYSELRDASGDRPVVVLNASQYGCDALILSSPSEPPHHVHLGDLTYENAENLREKLLKILSHQGIRNRYTERHGGPVFSEESSGEEMFRHLLGAIWKLIVEPVIGHLTSRQTHSPTANGCLRIRWCPTGPLAFLPIHAAGIYNADGTASSSLADIAVSSYMPTLTAMLNKSQETQVKKSLFKLLAVIQPNTPGVNALPGTKEELSRIRKHLPSSSINILNGSDAKITQVMSGLDECSWVHLACHGVQDASDPMESGLLLEDGRLGLSQIIHKRLPHAEFAFLSACQTATGDERRPEEAIHLAAGMLLAGYKGVIATMWSIRDDDAPFVADQVYSRILTDGKPNGAHPEVALHDAIQELRKQNGSSFSSWVPFIYMGA